MTEIIIECRLGEITTNPVNYEKNPNACNCDASCEIHLHWPDQILCLHDGENDHGHCPVAQG